MSEVRNDDKKLSTHDIAAAGDVSARTAVQDRFSTSPGSPIQSPPPAKSSSA